MKRLFLKYIFEGLVEIILSDPHTRFTTILLILLKILKFFFYPKFDNILLWFFCITVNLCSIRDKKIDRIGIFSGLDPFLINIVLFL